MLGAVGLMLLIYTAISTIQKIESAFNDTWHLEHSRSLIQRFSDYLSVLMVGPVLVFGAVAITASLGSHKIASMLDTLPFMNQFFHLLGSLVPYLLVIGAFTFIYLVVPNNGFRQGSYGARSDGTPRSPNAFACLPQSVASCP